MRYYTIQINCNKIRIIFGAVSWLPPVVDFVLISVFSVIIVPPSILSPSFPSRSCILLLADSENCIRTDLGIARTSRLLEPN